VTNNGCVVWDGDEVVLTPVQRIHPIFDLP